MQVGVRRRGMRKVSNEIDRIACEDLGVSNVQPIVVDAEVGSLANLTPHFPVERTEKPPVSRRCFQLLHFEGAAKDRRQVSDVLGDQKVMLHESLDGPHAAARRIAKALRHCRLHFERQHFLCAARQEMQEAAHAPKKVLATTERLHFFRREDAGFNGGRTDFLFKNIFR